MMQTELRESDVLETLDLSAWDGPFDPMAQARAGAALEAGRVVFLPNLAFEVAPEERGFLTPETVDRSRKNITLDPATGSCHGTGLQGGELERLSAMIDRFGRQATDLVRGLVPHYVPSLARARTTFRPVEVETRPSSWRHDDRLLHVDAFPSRPLRGRRILRVFSNVAPDGAVRQWNLGEPFPSFAEKYLGRIRPGLPGADRLLHLLGITKGRRSAYDRIMLGLHDEGKRDAAYQAGGPKVGLSFPPGSTWMVFTDQALHAALAGRFALEQTLHLPVEGMIHPEQSPLRVLERLSGRALV
jgi:3-deoxy-D-manno-oct-2-ulosonic acid (Kdo) hydroxylase